MDVGRNIDGLKIRLPREEDFPQIVAMMSLAFGGDADGEDLEDLRRAFPWERATCAYGGDRVVGSLAAYSLELTVPGHKVLPAGGITWGSTLPTHRRRGILKALVEAQLADGVNRGEPVSALLASEANIYPRFGYGPATHSISFSIDRAHAGFVGRAPDPAPRSIGLVSTDEAAVRLDDIYEARRVYQPGAVSRPAGWWAHYLHDPEIQRQGATRMYHAIHQDARGRDDGYVSYRVKPDWSAAPNYEVQVLELVAGDQEAYAELWEYVIGTDLCQRVSCAKGRIDEPLRWMLADPRRLMVDGLVDDLYVRLLDVPRALAGREYATAGELTLEVFEAFPTARTTRYLLRSGGRGAGAECTPTDGEPDIRLPIEALGAAYLGGVTFTTLAAAGRVWATGPAVISAADAMFFSSVVPYCSTMF